MVQDYKAISLLRDFVKEKLDGDIRKLKTYDFSSLDDDRKYGSTNHTEAPIVKAVMSLAFGDVWPELSMDQIDRGPYKCATIQTYQNLFGINMCDQYFKGMQFFKPLPSQFQRALKVAHMTYSIGNLWVLPGNGTISNLILDNSYRYYMDKFLKNIYAVLTQQKRIDKALQKAIENSPQMKPYYGEEGFKKFISDMMLEDYVDYYGKPMDIFDFVWSSQRGLDREKYFNAVDQYCSFCEKAFVKRAEKIVDKLDAVLSYMPTSPKVETVTDNSRKRLTKYDFEYKIVTECLEFAMKGKMGILTDKNYFTTLCAKMKLQPEGFSWDDFIVETKKLEDDFIVIIYHYPKPTKEPEALYGAILVDNYWGRVTYYTLEMCNHKGRWALGINESGGHSLVGLYDIEPTIQNFLKLIVPPTQTIPDVDLKALLGLPSNYKELNDIQKKVEGCVSFVTATSNCKAIIQAYIVSRRKAMPYDDVKVIIKGIHMSLSDDQALIEVKAGKTRNSRKYVYSIVKSKQDSSRVDYIMQMNVEYDRAAIYLSANFIEAGMTGLRDTMIWELACREGLVSISDNSKWMFDPYDKFLKRPYMMNLSEKEEYDEMFPDHPLSQCRKFVKLITERL